MYNSFIKSFIDRCFGFLLTSLSAPIVLILMLIIRINSKGSPLFIQKRIGLNGKIFPMYKLRSMYVDQPSNSSHFTTDNDPRITPIGKFIRKTSLDELPQLWNLLSGDMSLIGPRPDVPTQKSLYSEADFRLRHSVKPGITGLAQSTLRSTGTFEDRLQLDLIYVEKRSLIFDFEILLKTVRILFASKAN